MIERPWVGFASVSGMGFALFLISAFTATDSVWGGLGGVSFIFLGWVVISAVFWLASVSAAYAVLESRTVFPRKQVHYAAQLIVAGIQAFTYLIPNAAASLTWEPQSRLLDFLTLAFMMSGLVLLTLGILLAIWTLTQRSLYRGKTPVRIRVMHRQGHWPVWFDNEIMDEMDKAPISEGLKSRGIALSQLFESLTTWDSKNDRFEWVSDLTREQFNNASRSFAQDLAKELGSKFFVATEGQRTKKKVVELELETFSFS